MDDETDNTADEAVTDNVNPSDDDNGEDFSYYDPDEDDQDTVDADESDPTDDEEEEAEPEVKEESTEAVSAYAEDTAVVKLPDGTEMPVAELRNGYLRQSDFTRKTQELSNERERVRADASRIEGITQAFVDYMASLMPAEPDQRLIYSDPVKYTQQKAIYDQALGKIQELIEIGSQPKEVRQQMAQTDQQAAMRATQEALVQKIPQMATKDGFGKVMVEVAKAANAVGFTNEDLQSALSLPKGAALIELAHWAQKGMEAEKAKAAAKAKAQKAPPSKPNKPGHNAGRANKNRDAMKKLARSGSIQDALRVDFD